MNTPVLFVVGPTAVGKSALAIRLAHQYRGEIISADSMQIYKGMDIGTAKPDEAEQQGIRHHLISLISHSQRFSAHQFYQTALDSIRDISNRGLLPIVVGGTGFYIRSLVYGMAPDLGDASAIRKRYESIAVEEGLGSLYEKLKEIDPERASKIQPRDKKRVIRALEIYEQSHGKKPSELILNSVPITSLGYEPVLIGLIKDRMRLYADIDARVDAMMRGGLLDEVKRLAVQDFSDSASQAVGYKELLSYLQGQTELADAVVKIKQGTRNLAKRQLTWFKKEAGVKWFDVDQQGCFEDIISYLDRRLK